MVEDNNSFRNIKQRVCPGIEPWEEILIMLTVTAIGIVSAYILHMDRRPGEPLFPNPFIGVGLNKMTFKIWDGFLNNNSLGRNSEYQSILRVLRKGLYTLFEETY